MRLAYFGLPLAGCLLAEDGHDVALAVLSPVPAVGARRLVRRLGPDRVVRVDGEGRYAAEVATRLAAAAPDLVVSWFWTRKLPADWIARGRLGGVGVHPSLLPRHRGPNPYFWTIDVGDTVTGVTVHRLTAEYDRGDVLATRTLAVGERDAWQLARALDRPSLAALRATVRRLAEGDVAGTPQVEAEATWAPEPTGEALRVDFRWPSERVLRRVRALGPTPGLALEIREVRCFVLAATRSEEVPSALVPGEAGVAREGPPRVLLRTGDGAIAVTAAVVVEDTDAEEGVRVDGEELARRIFGPRVLDSGHGGC